MLRGSLYWDVNVDLEEETLRITGYKQPFYYGRRLKATIEYDGTLFIVKTFLKKDTINGEHKFLKYRNALDFAKEYLYSCKY